MNTEAGGPLGPSSRLVSKNNPLSVVLPGRCFAQVTRSPVALCQVGARQQVERAAGQAHGPAGPWESRTRGTDDGDVTARLQGCGLA